MTAFVAALFFVGVAGGPTSANPIDPPGVLTFAGAPRTYLGHATPGRAPVALVRNLHGSGMTGGDQARLTDYNAVADQ
jgi:polyhydroxybutyrate depolymerase